MKTRSNKRMIALVLAATSLALLTGCGAASNSGAVAPGAAGVGGIGGGCVPINTTTMIGFTATNMYMGNPQTGDMRVLAGIIPPGDQLASGGTNYGTMIVQPGNIATPVLTQASLGNFQGQRVDGTTIQMSVSSAIAPVTTGYTGYPYSAYPANGMVNATGYIQVSSFIQSLLVQTAMGGTTGFGTSIGNTYPGSYPTGYPAGYGTTTQICVSNLAISLQRTNSSFANWLYQGTVYFYLSGGVTNGQHGLALNF